MAPVYSMAFFSVVVLATIFHVNAQTDTTGVCDDTWRVNDGKCYKLVLDPRENAENALAQCENMGSTLATYITDECKEFAIAVILESGTYYSVLIGGRLSADLADLTWTEGENITSNYTNWAIGFPKNRGVETCIAVNKWGRWKNKNCIKRQPYACQKTLECDVENCVGCISDNYCTRCEDGFADIARNGSCVDMSLACDDTWALHEDHCYKVMTYDEEFYIAEDTCVDEGGYLTPVTSAAENVFVTAQLEANLLESGSAWVGLNEFANGTMITIDTGAETTYTNWALRFPDVTSVQDICVSVNDRGSWKTQPCIKRLPFMCRKLWNFGAEHDAV